MDPAEFEGTVERSEEALGAGVLEQLLNDAPPKFVPLDMTKDLGDLHLAMYNLKESVTQYEKASLNDVNKELDGVAIRLAELKEDYVNRRKNLTMNVKRFTTDYLSDETENPLANACREIIAQFKKEFDGLSTLAKFSESAFTDIYKIIRELPDPVHIATDGLNICLKVSELLSRAQDQLQVANTIINEPAAPAATAGQNQQYVKQVELDRIHSQYSAENEELRQSYLNEVANLRSKYESDIRGKELSLTAVFEKQHNELQQQLDAMLAKKEVEISSMLRSLNDHQSKNQELDERSRLLDAEMIRRRELEEKWRAAVVSLSDMRTSNQELSAALDKTNKECMDLRAKSDTTEMAATKHQSAMARQIDALTSKTVSLESQLDSRPPCDLTALMDSISSVTGHKGEFSSPDTTENLSWSQFEARLLDAVRRSDADATQGRVKLQESARQLTDLQSRCSALKAQLATQTALIASLEHDLQLAHEAVQASSSSKGTKMVSKMFKVINASASDAHLETLINTKGGDSSRPADADDLEANDAERNTPSGVSPAAGLGTDASYNVNDRILLAVQSQRDRYMRASKEKDGELVELKAKLDRVSDEQLQLRNENLELYRRLRVLRVSGAPQNSASAAHGTNVGYGSSADHNARSRRSSAGDSNSSGGGKDEFELDEKYMSLYEAEISPFRVEELDRQHMLSRLNFFERGLAYVNRHILQDRWARHALLVYLALVHVLALIYVCKVLNPELIEEVDAHMKSKWSTETLSMPEHPDN